MLAAKLFADLEAVLCIGAHPDDIEIGCGGTLITLLTDRHEVDVRWLVLTATAERRAEVVHSAELYLGDPDKLVTHDLRDGFLPYDDPAAVKQALFDARRAFTPDLVMAPSRSDAHQDHRLLGELVWQVFRDQLILEYEIVKYDGDLGPSNVYVPIAAAAAQTKVDRLFSAYVSQHDKPWFRRSTFEALMRIRAVEAGAATEFAEAFTAAKLVLS